MNKSFLTAQKKSVMHELKTAIQKTAETTGDLVGNTIADKITKASSKSICDDQTKSAMPAQTD